MEEAYKKLEALFPGAVDEAPEEMKWSDLKIIHSMLLDVKEQTGPEITSEIAQATIKNFFGEGYCGDASSN